MEQSKLALEKERGWKWRAIIIAFADVLSINICVFFALWLRFDFSVGAIDKKFIDEAIRVLPGLVVTMLLIFYFCKLYHSIWRFAGVDEVFRAVQAFLIAVPVVLAEAVIFHVHLPRSTYLIAYILEFMCCVGIRLSYRAIRILRLDLAARHDNTADHIMVIGGGQCGRQLIREMTTSSHINGRIECIIDDNPNKKDLRLEGVRIVGGRDMIPEAVEKYQINRIIYAIPAAKPKDRQEILNLCKETGCHIQTVPGLYQVVNGEVSVSKLRDVEIEDLLGREEVQVNNDEIFAHLKDKVVLVTGGGGSIGSELCRQVAEAGPRQLIIFDIYENNAYEIQQELKRKYEDRLELIVLIGSVRDSKRIKSIMEAYHPDVVYHAAAHKHVPLMEDSPNEAIKNNVMGTYKMAMAAAECGVKSFTLISTDKAVNPTNVMGASKRMCEMIIQMMSRKYPATRFAAVRFGNVLGSNGSVIPLFKQQIAEGGPVTVTDKNIIRYFMTIREAVSLVLQASYYAKGGEIFVLDMGEPVRIDDMARNLIKLSGLVPDEDIEIRYTGLRPGEKLYEELLMDEEGLQDTDNRLIHIGRPIEMDDEAFLDQIEEIDVLCKNEQEDVRGKIAEIVSTYQVNQAE